MQLSAHTLLRVRRRNLPVGGYLPQSMRVCHIRWTENWRGFSGARSITVRKGTQSTVPLVCVSLSCSSFLTLMFFHMKMDNTVNGIIATPAIRISLWT